jgi:hypothetical protein
MIKLSPNSVTASSKFQSSRQIPHFRMENDDPLFEKYELGKKLGQVRLISFSLIQ